METDAQMPSPERLDQYLARIFRLSRAQAVKRIREGKVTCNGVVVRKASKQLLPGDTVEMVARASARADARSAWMEVHAPPLPILYEDAACLVIDKPAGIVVHPTGTMDAAEPTVLDLLLQGRAPGTLLLVHRLDRGTSGCLLLAKSEAACEALQRQFKERTVEKRYLAIVAGIPSAAEATIDAPIGRSLTDRTRMSLFRTSHSRHAVTTYKVLSQGKDCALLLCGITTGRTHQIRVHLASIGHPILGDAKYGDERRRSIARERGIASPCLHAWSLAFTSPATEKRREITAPVPEGFRGTAEKLGLAHDSLAS